MEILFFLVKNGDVFEWKRYVGFKRFELRFFLEMYLEFI